MKNTNHVVYFFIAVTLIFGFSSESLAQKIKVKKVKGTAAVIESSIPLEEGQVYDLAVLPVAQDVDFKNTASRSRLNSFSFGGDFFSGRGDNFSQTEANITARYGWNFTSLELGPLLSLGFLDEGGGAQTDIRVGGYFDYNFIANRDPKIMVYGLTASLSFGTRSFPDSQGGGSASLIDATGGGFLSWFFNGSSTALRIEGFANIRQVSTTAKQTNITGIGGRGLIVLYF